MSNHHSDRRRMIDVPSSVKLVVKRLAVLIPANKTEV